MYLTKIQLDMRTRNLRNAIWDCQRMHRHITGLFGSARREKNILYRLNPGTATSTVYLYSDIPVSEDNLLPGMQLSGTRSMDEWIEQLSTEKTYGFDLLAMPSKKVAFEYGKNSRRVLLPTQEERLDWLMRKAKQGGFAILQVQEVNSTDNWGQHAAEQGGKFYFSSCHYQGTLTITDKAEFRETLRKGVGPEKAYGLGMLLLR